MSTATITVPGQVGGVRAYAVNVGLATRSLLAALLAVKPQPVAAAAANAEAVSVRSKEKNMASVFRLANEYDAVMPNLASELRLVASRG